ncbi:hypothetical protein AAZX31_15G037200 [Glycine max]
MMMTGVTPQRTPRNPIQWTFRGVCYSLFLAHEVCFVLLQLKKMCKEGVYWGTIAGVYVGMEYGVERIRGTRDWKNAMIGGAVTGALVSAASNNKKDKIAIDAITGAAIATAAEFINYLT